MSAEFLMSLNGIHDRLADSHEKLRRGQVWCRTCGHTLQVDSAHSLRQGWPKHCGFTMTIDAPTTDASQAQGEET